MCNWLCARGHQRRVFATEHVLSCRKYLRRTPREAGTVQVWTTVLISYSTCSYGTTGIDVLGVVFLSHHMIDKAMYVKIDRFFLAPFGAATSLKYVVSEVHIWLTFVEINLYCTGILCTAFGSFCRFFLRPCCFAGQNQGKNIKTGCMVSTCLCLVRLWSVLFILSCSQKTRAP